MFDTYGLRNNESVLASNAMEGKPFSVSETMWCYPNEQQYQFLPNLGAYASLQDWDALVLFGIRRLEKRTRALANATGLKTIPF